jgi:hypothetical protein
MHPCPFIDTTRIRLKGSNAAAYDLALFQLLAGVPEQHHIQPTAKLRCIDSNQSLRAYLRVILTQQKFGGERFYMLLCLVRPSRSPDYTITAENKEFLMPFKLLCNDSRRLRSRVKNRKIAMLGRRDFLAGGGLTSRPFPCVLPHS